MSNIASVKQLDTSDVSSFDIESQASFSKGISSQYVEKIICNKCNNVFFRPAELHELKTSIDDKQSFFAKVVTKFQCPCCDAKDFTSLLVSNTESNDNILSFKNIISK